MGNLRSFLKSRPNVATGSVCPWHCETCINYPKKHSRPQSNFFYCAWETNSENLRVWAAIKPKALVTTILHFDVAHNSSVTKKKKINKKSKYFQIILGITVSQSYVPRQDKNNAYATFCFLFGGLGRGVLGVSKVYWQCENSDDIKPVVQHKIPAGLRTGLLRR